jgi:hypothetical protein
MKIEKDQKDERKTTISTTTNTEDPQLLKCLALLRSDSDERKFAALLILSKLFHQSPPSSYILEEIFSSTVSTKRVSSPPPSTSYSSSSSSSSLVGDGFLFRMFWTGIDGLLRSKDNEQQIDENMLYIQIAVNMLLCFCDLTLPTSSSSASSSALLSICQLPLLKFQAAFFSLLSLHPPLSLPSLEKHLETHLDSFRSLSKIATSTPNGILFFLSDSSSLTLLLQNATSSLSLPPIVQQTQEIISLSLELIQYLLFRQVIKSSPSLPPSLLSKFISSLAHLFAESQSLTKFHALSTLVSLSSSGLLLLSDTKRENEGGGEVKEKIIQGLIDLFSNRLGTKEKVLCFHLFDSLLGMDTTSKNFKRLVELGLQRIRIELRVALEDDESSAQRSSSSSTASPDISSSLSSKFAKEVVLASLESLESVIEVILRFASSPPPYSSSSTSSFSFEELLKLREILIETLSAVVFFLNDALLLEDFDRNGLVLPSLRLFCIWISEETTTFLKETEVLLPFIFDALRYNFPPPVSSNSTPSEYGFSSDWFDGLGISSSSPSPPSVVQGTRTEREQVVEAVKIILPAFPLFTDSPERCETVREKAGHLLLWEFLYFLTSSCSSSPSHSSSSSSSDIQLLHCLHSLSNMFSGISNPLALVTQSNYPKSIESLYLVLQSLLPASLSSSTSPFGFLSEEEVISSTERYLAILFASELLFCLLKKSPYTTTKRKTTVFVRLLTPQTITCITSTIQLLFSFPSFVLSNTDNEAGEEEEESDAVEMLKLAWSRTGKEVLNCFSSNQKETARAFLDVKKRIQDSLEGERSQRLKVRWVEGARGRESSPNFLLAQRLLKDFVTPQ